MESKNASNSSSTSVRVESNRFSDDEDFFEGMDDLDSVRGPGGYMGRPRKEGALKRELMHATFVFKMADDFDPTDLQ